MKSRMESKMSSPMVIGVDIGKEVFHLVGFTADGKIAFRRRIRRLGLKDVFEKLPPCIVAMEACLSAHFVSRTLRALGHEPRIIPAIYVKPFVKGQKNDYNDAEAIAEAALRPNLRFFQEKSQDQLGRSRRDLFLSVIEYREERLAEGPRAGPNSNALLDQKGADLVDRRCSTGHQSRPHPMASLQIQLILALLLDEP